MQTDTEIKRNAAACLHAVARTAKLFNLPEGFPDAQTPDTELAVDIITNCLKDAYREGAADLRSHIETEFHRIQ